MKDSMRKILLIAVGLTAMLAGCSKDFLETEPTGLFTPEQLNKASKWNPDIIHSYVSGANATTFSRGTGGLNGHSDFGQKSVDIQVDLMSGDMEMTNASYGHFGEAADLTGTASDQSYYSYGNWRYYFRLVNAANSAFAILGSDKQAPKDEGNQAYYGQTKALRAYAYYNMLNLFSEPVLTSPDALGVPLYTLENASTGNPAKREKAADLYKFVTDEFKEAKEVLAKAEQRKNEQNKDMFNEFAVQGYLAYTYLQQGQWKQAYDEAVGVINNGGYRLMTANELLESGFRSWDNPEFIWSIDITKDNTGALITFWGHMDVFTMSYAFAGDMKIINPSLYKSIPNTDVRKEWFDSKQLNPSYKFYDAARKPGGDRVWTNDIVMLRLAEMYLIAAEGAYRSGDEANAKKYLKELLAQRYNYKSHDKDAAADREANITKGKEDFVKRVDNLSGESLLSEILYNWRIEMWGEGRGLMTMKRFQLTNERSSKTAFLTGETVKWDDKRLVFQAPEREITNNPNY